MIVATTDKYGEPQCPMCTAWVDREGEFCSARCFDEFHVVLHEMGVPLVDMNYLDLYEQSWYGEDHG